MISRRAKASTGVTRKSSPDSWSGRLCAFEIRNGRASRAARAGDGSPGPYPYIGGDGRRPSRSRGRRYPDQRFGSQDRRLSLFRPRAVGQYDRLGGEDHASAERLVVAQQDEKSQHKNKAKALKILRARLYELERQRLDDDRSAPATRTNRLRATIPSASGPIISARPCHRSSHQPHAVQARPGDRRGGARRTDQRLNDGTPGGIARRRGSGCGVKR